MECVVAIVLSCQLSSTTPQAILTLSLIVWQHFTIEGNTGALFIVNVEVLQLYYLPTPTLT